MFAVFGAVRSLNNFHQWEDSVIQHLLTVIARRFLIFDCN